MAFTACAARKCKHKSRDGQPFCSWHWFQVEPRIRYQLKAGRLPLSVAVLMIEALEKEFERLEKIDEAGGL